jgi:hypothetical protein
VTTVTRVFRSLGSEPTRREVALTAKAIRDSADLELFEEFGMTVPSGIVGSGEPTFDRRVVDRLVAAAARVGGRPVRGVGLVHRGHESGLGAVPPARVRRGGPSAAPRATRPSRPGRLVGPGTARLTTTPGPVERFAHADEAVTRRGGRGGRTGPPSGDRVRTPDRRAPLVSVGTAPGGERALPPNPWVDSTLMVTE